MATSRRIRIPARQLARFLWVAAICVATFAMYNYPRSWWQESLCATALVWTPLCVLGVCVELSRLARSGFSFGSCMLLTLNVMCVVKTVTITRPYVYAPAKSYSTFEYSRPTRVVFVDVVGRDNWALSHVANAIEEQNPDVVIATRYANTSLDKALSERYPHTLTSSVSSERVVEVFSKTPISSPVRTEYGYGALPGILGTLETSDGFRFQLGAMDLKTSSSQKMFNESRLTSRRLASALRYSVEPRIVVGAFRASITSQVVDMYVDQLKLRSIFFNSGLTRVSQAFGDSLHLSRNLNAFTARTIDVTDPTELRAYDRGFAALGFTVRIPRTAPPLLGIGG